MSSALKHDYSPVELWFTDDKDGVRRLMNTIKDTSRFFGFKAPNLDTLEGRIKCAEILRDGWINQGKKKGKWEIVTN